MAQEHLLNNKHSMKQNTTLRLTLAGMLAAVSIVLILLIRIPLLPGAPYLEYDMADVPVLLGAFVLGPGTGILILVVVSLIQAFMLGGNGIIGFIMHVVSSGVFVLVSAFLYRRWGDNNRSLLLSLLSGGLLMALIMIPLNLFFTPILFGMPVQAVAQLILPVVLPFNLIKVVLNGTLFFILYKSLRVVLRKYAR